MSSRLCIVLDANGRPFVCSLFRAVAVSGWRVVLVRVVTPERLISTPEVPFRLVQDGPVMNFTAVVPGFRRFRLASEVVLRLALRWIERLIGAPDVIVFTMPRYCNLIRAEKAFNVYFAYDAYKLYPEWDFLRTERDEDALLGKVDQVFAVSRRLCDDFRSKLTRPPVYLPNAVEGEFMRACRGGQESRLKGQSGPIIGCIGNINRSCDWGLVAKMADALPEAGFVFVGQITEVTNEMEEIRKKKNIVFTGWKRPEELAGYLAGFDVCLNPMVINALNERRSPLRFYTYLCSSKPVVSTAIDEARGLSEYILIGYSHEECVELVRKAVEGRVEVDLEKRRKFMLEQTWDQRAGKLMAEIDNIVLGA